MPLNPEAIGSFPVIGHDAEMNMMLDKLKNADAWNKAYEAMETSVFKLYLRQTNINYGIICNI
jgi:hypothetical protein